MRDAFFVFVATLEGVRLCGTVDFKRCILRFARRNGGLGMHEPVAPQGGRVERPGFRFAYPVRVRYAECDQQGVVFNGAYMTYLDVAVTEYFRFLGLDVDGLAKQGSFDMAVARCTMEWRGPARFDDLLEICCATRRIGNASFTVAFAIFVAGAARPLLTAETVYVNHNAHTRESIRVPDAIRAAIRTLEGDELEA